jgi:PAS domain S-box-containing protein
LLGVVLRNDDRLLGCLHVYRQEVRPFTDKQIALLQNFAQQAVIAMENARLLTETREALEQQTATAEVLQVINSSPGDLAPVFDAMLERALRLCDAAYGALVDYDGERFCATALRGVPPPLAKVLQKPFTLPPESNTARLIGGEAAVQTEDLATTEFYRSGSEIHRAFVELGDARTVLAVALRKDDNFLGALWFYRQEVRPFTDKQIALLQNFAAQAVIAMENARLLTETREALEQQSATAEVLQVINSSPGDLAPVFEAILEKAHTLCDAAHGDLTLADGENFCAVAMRGLPQAFADVLRRPFPRRDFHERLLDGVVHIADLTAPEFSSDTPVYRAAIGPGGVRTLLAVPLRRDGRLLGYITANRQEVRPFADKQIALLQNFAAQAVIAMENARLLTETREALEQQTATAEVLQVINSSPGDLAPVFDTMLEKATRLCEAETGTFWTYDGEYMQATAVRGASPSFAEFLNQGPYRPSSGQWRLIRGARVGHIADMTESDGYRSGEPLSRAAADLGGIRTLLVVPLRKDRAMLGTIGVYRRMVRPFTEKQIALLENFAAQAVIAMENARLMTETREALAQQTATAEVLQVINSSPGDLTPVFDAILEKAHALCDAEIGSLTIYDGEENRAVATRGLAPSLADQLRQGFRPGPAHPIRNLLSGARIVQVPDLGESADPIAREGFEIAGIRTSLYLPLRKDDRLLGQIVASRQEVRLFSDKEIALLENFAAQAVIAMENARLINETREALEQQTATAEILQVINSSPGDLAPVFDAILEKAMRLCEAAFGVLWTFEGEFGQVAALHGVPPAFEEFLTRGPHRETASTANSRLRRGENVVQIADSEDDDAYRFGEPVRRAMVELGGARTMLAVPLRNDGTLLGSFIIYRQEVRPFSDKQIALLQNFAAQAVIAMENARLIDEIRQRQAELRVTFDNMVDGVAMFDEALHLAAWNRNFQELLQLPDEVLAQRPDLDTYIRYLVERGEFGETDPETQIARLRMRIGDHYSFERTRPDGTVIEVRHNPMPGGGIVLIYSDITERKRSEAEIKAARDTAEAAYRDLKAAQASLIQAEKMASLGQLTAGIAHEIKNPLNFVNNFAGLSVELLDELKETAAPAISALDDDRRAEIDETIDLLSGNLDKIAEHGRRADNIVTSMLEHSHGSSGERRSVDLNALVEEALNLAYHGGRAKDQSFNITLERDYADTIALIELVPQDITRVCLNLFGNGFYAATKRQKEGNDGSFEPTLKVSTRDLGEAVEIRVRDNGIGILPEIKDKLFQPFFTTKPTGEGTGLGLSISYDIVTQEHGGTISVNSQIGKFTEFTVRLPRIFGATIAQAAS